MTDWQARAELAEAERDAIQHQEIHAAQIELNAMLDRALKAEAEAAQLRAERDKALTQWNTWNLLVQSQAEAARYREALEKIVGGSGHSNPALIISQLRGYAAAALRLAAASASDSQ